MAANPRVPFFENATEGTVEGLSAGLQEKVRAFRRPLYLLLLAEALVDLTKEVEINSPLRQRSP